MNSMLNLVILSLTATFSYQETGSQEQERPVVVQLVPASWYYNQSQEKLDQIKEEHGILLKPDGPPPSALELAEAAEHWRGMERRLMENRQRRNVDQAFLHPFLMRTLELMANDSSVGKSLELVPNQIEKVKDLLKQMEERIREINQQAEKFDDEVTRQAWIARETAKVRHDFTTKLKDILVDFQILELDAWDPSRFGVAHAVTRTPIGDVLGLSEADKRKIIAETKEVREELANAIVTARQKARRAVIEHLSKEQLKKLNGLMGGGLDQYFHNVPTDKFLKHMNLDEDE